ncbi:MAG: hypothetical protein ABI871_02135 [Chthoniobacterales bacterium]
MKLRRPALYLAAAVAWALFPPEAGAADTLDQIKSLSSLPALDLTKLEAGEVIGARAALGSFSRGVHAETVYFVRAPLAAVGEKLLHWDPASHPQLEIKTLRDYRWPAGANTWDALRFDSARSEDRWLLDRTAQLANGQGSGELHLTAPEKEAFTGSAASQRDKAVAEFWRKVLRGRDESIVMRGLVAAPSYTVGNIQINPHAELENLLGLAPRIAAHFSGLTNTAPFAAGQPPPEELKPYWEAALVRGHTSLHAAFTAAKKGVQSWQVADCTYYTSDTYFFSITFYELVAQPHGTLVWQIDFASAPFRSFTGGIDRVVAGNQMLKETARSARLFRSDVGKR